MFSLAWRFCRRKAECAVPQTLDALFKRVVDSNPTLLEFDTSPHESLHQGIMIHAARSAPHTVAEHALREVAHIHPADHSMHVLLSPQDCKLGAFSYRAFRYVRLTLPQ